jgi:transposase
VPLALPQGRDDCPRCAALEERVRELEEESAQLRCRLAELEDRLRANSSNSSTAPSSNPLWAPRLKPRKPTGKKPGGQQGHQGHYRTLLPIEQVDVVVRHTPQRCSSCGGALSEATLQLRWRHQVAELPPRAVIITEHQSYACRCARCGQVTACPIPAPIASRCTGARLDAALCYLSAHVHGSRRAVEDVAREVLGLELSLGTVMQREREMSVALAQAYQQVQQRVRQAAAKNVDETGWRRAGRWLWVAATRREALFRIDRGRNWHGLQNLLGELVQGTVCSDRHGLYDRLKLSRRAVCWAHLQRDFQRWIDRGGDTRWLGDVGMEITDAIFALWRRFTHRRIVRGTLQRKLRPLRRRMRRLLQRGIRCGMTKAKHFCRNVLKVEAALWTFARVQEIEPTNNHAERMLRCGVIWRKKCFGSHSAGGCRYAERMLTMVQTLRLRKAAVLGFLTQALHAHRHTLPSPVLA